MPACHPDHLSCLQPPPSACHHAAGARCGCLVGSWPPWVGSVDCGDGAVRNPWGQWAAGKCSGPVQCVSPLAQNPVSSAPRSALVRVVRGDLSEARAQVSAPLMLPGYWGGPDLCTLSLSPLKPVAFSSKLPGCSGLACIDVRQSRLPEPALGLVCMQP